MKNMIPYDMGIVLISEAEVREYKKALSEKVQGHITPLSPIEIDVLFGNLEAERVIALQKRGFHAYRDLQLK